MTTQPEETRRSDSPDEAHDPVAEPAPEGAPEPALPSLPKRLLDTIFSPGRMATAVAAHPRWIGALLVSTALVVLATALIPPDVMQEFQRRIIMERGGQMPDIPQRAQSIIRIASIVAAGVTYPLIAFLMAGVYTVIFAFVLGDEGRYKQYLAVMAHASVIPALAALLLVPLKISMQNPQFTLNVGSFLGFLPSGYVKSVFTAMDLTQIWATLITARGVHTIDPRRSFGSAAVILLCFVLVIALIVGRFLPS